MEPMEREAFLLHLVEIHRLPAIGRATGTTSIVPYQVDSVLWLKHDPLRLARQPAETLAAENARLHELAQQYRISTSRQELIDLGVRVKPLTMKADTTWYEHGEIVFDCWICRAKFRGGYPDGSKGCSNLGRPMHIALAKSHVQLHVPDDQAAQDMWKLEVYSYGAGPGQKNIIPINQREIKTLSQILVSSALVLWRTASPWLTFVQKGGPSGFGRLSALSFLFLRAGLVPDILTSFHGLFLAVSLSLSRCLSNLLCSDQAGINSTAIEQTILHLYR